MTAPIRIVAISGSLRRNSMNAGVIRAAAELLPRGVELVVADLAGLPAYNEDVERAGLPEAVAAFKAAFADADAVLISTPEYNGSIPGVLKNALDWASRPKAENVFRGRLVATVGVTPGQFGAAWALEHLDRVLGVLGAEKVGESLQVGGAWDRFNADGDLTDAAVRESLGRLLGELVAAAAARRPEAAAQLLCA